MDKIPATPSLRLDDPNTLQEILISDIEPSEHNARLFFEYETLTDLIALYTRHEQGLEVILPPPPVLRYRGEGKRLEVLRGHRRVLAAWGAGKTSLACFVVNMQEADAYLYIMDEHEQVKLTTAERAYRAVEMERMGFSIQAIEKRLGGVSIHRYRRVGLLLSPEMFSDTQKLCDPSITVWDECAKLGPEHFLRCFQQWNLGAWDEQTCNREFRNLGRRTPQESTLRGLRLSVSADRRKLLVRGTLDLDLYDDWEMDQIVSCFVNHIRSTVKRAQEDRQQGYGRRFVQLYDADWLREQMEEEDEEEDPEDLEDALDEDGEEDEAE